MCVEKKKPLKASCHKRTSEGPCVRNGVVVRGAEDRSQVGHGLVHNLEEERIEVPHEGGDKEAFRWFHCQSS